MSISGKLDRDTVVHYEGPVDPTAYHGGQTEVVDHAASAQANLKEVGEDLKKGFTPDKTAECIRAIKGDGQPDTFGVGKAMGILKLPVAIVADVAEVAIMPLVAVKDAVDAAIHGIAAGLHRHRHNP